MPRKYADEYEQREAEVAQRQRSKGVRDPFPRGRCPRCGSSVALTRDQSRTQVHLCWSRSDEDLFEHEYGSSEIPVAVDMATGDIARDPSGIATAAQCRLNDLRDLKALLGADTQGSRDRAEIEA